MTDVMTPVAKEALRAQVLRLLPGVAPFYEEMEREYVESRIPYCAWRKKNRTYARALAREEEGIFSYVYMVRVWKKDLEKLYEGLLTACDNAVDVVHLDFKTLKRVFG